MLVEGRRKLTGWAWGWLTRPMSCLLFLSQIRTRLDSVLFAHYPCIIGCGGGHENGVGVKGNC